MNWCARQAALSHHRAEAFADLLAGAIASTG
jgi:hypothetical protein